MALGLLEFIKKLADSWLDKRQRNCPGLFIVAREVVTRNQPYSCSNYTTRVFTTPSRIKCCWLRIWFASVSAPVGIGNHDSSVKRWCFWVLNTEKKLHVNTTQPVFFSGFDLVFKRKTASPKLGYGLPESLYNQRSAQAVKEVWWDFH